MNPQARLLFWLLVAATIAVDAATIVMLVREGPQPHVVAVYATLAASQLAVVCIWARFTKRPAWLAWLAVLAAVGVCGVLSFLISGMQGADSFGIYGSFAATLILALWLVGGSAARQRLASIHASAWQFSLGQLLAAMTVIALLATVLRTSGLIFIGTVPFWQVMAVITVSDVLVVVATLLAWLRPWHWMLRLATALATSLAIGVVQTVAVFVGLLGSPLESTLQNDLLPDLVSRAILASVVFAWLEIGGIVPVDRRAEATPPAGDAG